MIVKQAETTRKKLPCRLCYSVLSINDAIQQYKDIGDAGHIGTNR